MHTLVAVYEDYVSELAPGAHGYLSNVLDWDNDADQDLKALAKVEGDWQTKLSGELGPTEEQHEGKDVFSLRYSAVLVWTGLCANQAASGAQFISCS